MRNAARYLISLLLLCSATGATCMPRPQNASPLAPQVFMHPPSLAELTQVLNATSGRVTRLQSQEATVSVANVAIPLRADIAIQRPNRFRLKGRMLGPEFDLGGNEELVWFWAKRDPAEAIYVARQDQRANSRLPIPIEPRWLVEAFGLVELSPHNFHEGPYSRGNGQVEIRSRIPSRAGDLTRSLLVDSTYGWIVQQHVFDASGRLLFAVAASNHVYYAEADISLPHRIDIEVPPLGVALRVEPHQYSINGIFENPQELWHVPAYLQGHQQIDLASARVPFVPQATSHPFDQVDRSSYRPRYRGQSDVR